jgi:hypothetical protein
VNLCEKSRTPFSRSDPSNAHNDMIGKVRKQLPHTFGQNLNIAFFVAAGMAMLRGFIPLSFLPQRTTLPSGEWLPAGQLSGSGPIDVWRDRQMVHTALCQLQE